MAVKNVSVFLTYWHYYIIGLLFLLLLFCWWNIFFFFPSIVISFHLSKSLLNCSYLHVGTSVWFVFFMIVYFFVIYSLGFYLFFLFGILLKDGKKSRSRKNWRTFWNQREYFIIWISNCLSWYRIWNFVAFVVRWIITLL